MTCRRRKDDREQVYVKDEHLDCCCPDPVNADVTGHLEGCPQLDHPDDCPGCAVCEERHCAVCTRHLDVAEVRTCVACRGQARRDATAIVELAALLPPHALHAGRDAHLVAAEEIPGGDALVLMSRGSEGFSEDGYSRVSLPTEPPSWTLGWWETQIRAARGLEPPVLLPVNRRRPARTLVQAATFLLGNADLDAQLDWAASHFPAFHALANDLDTTRRRLEELLYAGDPAAQGVACFTCGHTLEREYRPPKPCTCGPRPRGGHMYPHSPTDRCCLGCAAVMRWELKHSNCDQGGMEHIASWDAGWSCPRCRRVYSAGEYQLAVKARHDEVAEWARIEDASRLTDTTAGTIKVWATRGYVRRRKDESGRTTYSLADIREKRPLDKPVQTP